MSTNKPNINEAFGILSSIRFHWNNSLIIYTGFRRLEFRKFD
jgi:hypothetical protein